jgi:outer membrane protein assembly factor BamB
MLIIQADVQKGSFVAAFNVKTGEQVWRTPRNEVPTWSTPAVVTHEGRTQLVVNGRNHIGGYDLRTGRELWRLSSTANLPVPTPIFGHGLIFIAGVRGPASPLFAVRPTATGDISLAEGQTSNAHVAWSDPKYGSYSTPLLYGDYLYGIEHQGVLVVYEAKTGKQVYQQRLASGWFSASPVANAGRVYVTSEEGEVFVVKAGPTYELIARNQLQEPCLASPAISEGRLFFRTQDHLIAF